MAAAPQRGGEASAAAERRSVGRRSFCRELREMAGAGEETYAMELAIPHLRILGYDRAVEFYVDALGFQIDFEWRHQTGFPVYMGISRGTLRAHLSEHEGSGAAGGGRGMTLAVADVDRWYERLRENGVVFEREIATQPWGARDFIVHDPFGNTIVVTSDVG